MKKGEELLLCGWSRWREGGRKGRLKLGNDIMAVKFVTTSEVARERREEKRSFWKTLTAAADISVKEFSLHCGAETVFTNRRFPWGEVCSKGICRNFAHAAPAVSPLTCHALHDVRWRARRKSRLN